MGKTALQSKTIKVNSLVAMLATLAAFIPQVQPVLTGKMAAIAAGVVALINIFLRYQTKEPIV